MASVVARLSRPIFIRSTSKFMQNAPPKSMDLTRHIVRRTVVSSTSGAILPKPVKVPFGLFRMTIVVVPFLYVGTLISKNFAALLEEHEIFVPDDDDDDD